MTGIVDELAGIRGLDAAAGLLLCGRREALYRSALHRFVETYGEGDARFDSGELADVRQAAHSLAGASGLVGATLVAASARELEQRARVASALAVELQVSAARLQFELRETVGEIRLGLLKQP